MNIKNKILAFNRNPQLSPWFDRQLDLLIKHDFIVTDLEQMRDGIIDQLVDYRNTHNINTVVIGMSGGIDSALTAALFKQAGWNVKGVLVPIHQNTDETLRGELACKELGIDMQHCDLTDAYDHFVQVTQNKIDPDINESLIRQGNIRARLRMITLYNLASKENGLVGSTDNFSEMAAGFWTLHGDVGDVAPIQNLTKSWEVPALAEYLGVPQAIIDAVPTDGLGISHSDEDQFGFSYLELDIALLTVNGHGVSIDAESQTTLNQINNRVRCNQYKRDNPVNLKNPLDPWRVIPPH
jgi:nicotinamide-nucleotide amidase